MENRVVVFRIHNRNWSRTKPPGFGGYIIVYTIPGNHRARSTHFFFFNGTQPTIRTLNFGIFKYNTYKYLHRDHMSSVIEIFSYYLTKTYLITSPYTYYIIVGKIK